MYLADLQPATSEEAKTLIPALNVVPDDDLQHALDELATCSACYRSTALSDGVLRVQVSSAGAVEAGGLRLTSTSDRRIRWDVYLTP